MNHHILYSFIFADLFLSNPRCVLEFDDGFVESLLHLFHLFSIPANKNQHKGFTFVYALHLFSSLAVQHMHNNFKKKYDSAGSFQQS